MGGPLQERPAVDIRSDEGASERDRPDPATHVSRFLDAVVNTAERIFPFEVSVLIAALAAVKQRRGRVFVVGLGGSAANASHMVNDLRKLCGIDAQCPMDNVAEMTARINDDGWRFWIADWLRVARLKASDALFVLSVGGGSEKVSQPITCAVRYAKGVGAKVLGIIGSSDGETAVLGDEVMVIPEVLPEWRTPLSESFQAVIWHCIVNHPLLKRPCP